MSSQFLTVTSTFTSSQGRSRTPSHSPYDSTPVSPTTPAHFHLPSSGISSPTPPPLDKYHQDYDDDDDDDDETSLPFPQPLSRSAFSPHTAPTFSPNAFLASLHHRHQTLEDLRLELRNRSRDLERELVELVNAEYADFVGLGRSLAGGEGKVEDLRVGLLQFRREMESLVEKLSRTEGDVKRELERRRKVVREMMLVKGLLAVAQRLDDLEMLLLLDDTGASGEQGTATDAGREQQLSFRALQDLGDDGDASIANLSHLTREVNAYLCLKYSLSRLPPGTVDSHPFLKAQTQRIERIRKTILLDLGTALRSAAVRREEGLLIEAEEEKRKGKVVGVMELFLTMGEEAEAVRILKGVGGSRAIDSTRKGSLRRTETPIKAGSLRMRNS